MAAVPDQRPPARRKWLHLAQLLNFCLVVALYTHAHYKLLVSLVYFPLRPLQTYECDSCARRTKRSTIKVKDMPGDFNDYTVIIGEDTIIPVDNSNAQRQKLFIEKCTGEVV